ncbi:MAG TPA: hypothetical protein VN706_04315 [Gemmatimonadaceae bacterium]|nr:hypothetical protein [Gemmatimonadaceae bacterium]
MDSRIPARAPGELVSAAATVDARRAVKAKHIVTVNRPSADVYAVARQWVSDLPDVEIVNDKKNEVIAWKTKRDSKVSHAGSVNVHETADTATEARIEIDYEPPGVSFGALFDQLTSELLNAR